MIRGEVNKIVAYREQEKKGYYRESEIISAKRNYTHHGG